MKNTRNNWILYLITTTIITTIVVQLYWNYKNYEQNKQYVINEIQESLDSAIEEYFAKISKENSYTFIASNNKGKEKKKEITWDSIIGKILPKRKQKSDFISIQSSFTSTNPKDLDKLKHIDTLFYKTAKKRFHFNFDCHDNFDSMVKNLGKLQHFSNFANPKEKNISTNIKNENSDVFIFSEKKAKDNKDLIEGLQTILISIKNDSINHKILDSILQNTLNKKGIKTPYYVTHIKNGKQIKPTKKVKVPNYTLKAEAKSTFLGLNEKLTLFYGGPTYETLKRSSTGILLSLVLSLAVIASLFYLLQIINKQKELAEIKNDLISNITHEFKTPITTISTAIEAIDNFNIIEDKEKTKRYLSISSLQLKKLHQMVEKLLETATLDSEKLLLKKEIINLIDLVEKTVKKHQPLAKNKKISFSSSSKDFNLDIDTFHFENAISNLIDNAIKYGGNRIEINVNIVLNTIEISVADNGRGIEKNQQERIFDKFYRVPKGNTHDVKGFDIGLYYTKKIIEKHGGNIHLISNTKHTIFKINIPNNK